MNEPPKTGLVESSPVSAGAQLPQPRVLRILRNAARCAKCGDEIESKTRHDFVTCGCGALSVDGGRAYIRRIGEYGQCIDLSEYEEEAAPGEQNTPIQLIKEEETLLPESDPETFLDTPDPSTIPAARLVTVKHITWMAVVNALPLWLLRDERMREALNLAFAMGVAARDIAFDLDLETKEEWKARAEYELKLILEAGE
jgi:hypothetical protein